MQTALPQEWFKTKKQRTVAIILHVLSYVITALGAIKVYSVYSQNNNSNTQTQICGEVGSGETLGGNNIRLQKETCKSTNFDQTEWNTSRYEELNGYWCPKNIFDDPVMWLNKPTTLSFVTFSVEYEIKKGRQDFHKPQSLVLEFAQIRDKGKAVSDKTVMPVYKLWVPEGTNNQLFRFSRNNDYSVESNEPLTVLTPEEANELSSEVANNQIDVFSVDQTRRDGKEQYVNFIYTYTPTKINKGISDTISKTIKLPTSDAGSSEEIFAFGIGTFKGNCIRPVSYKICSVE